MIACVHLPPEFFRSILRCNLKTKRMFGSFARMELYVHLFRRGEGEGVIRRTHSRLCSRRWVRSLSESVLEALWTRYRARSRTGATMTSYTTTDTLTSQSSELLLGEVIRPPLEKTVTALKSLRLFRWSKVTMKHKHLVRLALGNETAKAKMATSLKFQR